MSDQPPLRLFDRDALVKIVEAVGQATGVGMDEICADDLRAHIVAARHLAFYIARRDFQIRNNHVARAFGVDHSTVINAMTRFPAKLEANHELRVALAVAREQLRTNNAALIEEQRNIRRLRWDAHNNAKNFVRRKAQVRQLYASTLPPFELSTHAPAAS